MILRPRVETPKRLRRTSALGWALIAALAALSFLAVELAAPGSTEPRAAGRHVLVVSVDGMGSSFYMRPPPGLRIPNIRRLMKEGSFAEAVEGVYPTLTYPSHTTIVTGRMPAAHGIYTNLISREPGKNPRDWFWFSKAIKVPTLWDEAREHHLSSASVAWPVTAGAAIDWDLPEIWDPAKGEVPDAAYVAQFMNPLLALELVSALGPPQPGSDDDSNRTRLAVYLIKKHQPDLLLVHLEGLDATEHRYGPESPEAAAMLERIDTHIGEILAATREAGWADSADVFILSDHGFKTIERTIHPNVLLVKAGLLTADDSGNLTGGSIATVANGGSFFIYWPPAQNLRRKVEAALEPLREQGLVWAEFGPEALKDMGADPEAQLALEAPDGGEFTSEAKGALVTEMTKAGGTHGFLPFRSGLDSSFIAAGPGIRAGVDLERIRMTRIGPTILEAMGIRDPHFGEEPPLGGISK